jgi:ubiquinone biosynthesis protein Coq4
MWNLYKIGKSLHHLFTSYGEAGTNGLSDFQSDLIGDDRLDHVLVLYREMNIPFGFISTMKMRQRKRSRDIIWGRGFNDRTYVESIVIPTLMDFEYLKRLAPNTVGAHYYNLVKKWGIQDLYNQRFKPEERREGRFVDNIYNSFSDDIRENVSRHNLLSHDIWHVLFRYDTSPLGEGCIQTISRYQAHYWPMHIIGFGAAFKLAIKHRSFGPLKVWSEACRLGKQASRALTENSPVDLLERDIEEVRDEYNIGQAVEYAKWVKQNPGSFRMDTIHPQYKDKLFTDSVVL